MAEVIFLNESQLTYTLKNVYGKLNLNRKLYVLSIYDLKLTYNYNQKLIDDLNNNSAYLLICCATEKISWIHIKPILNYLGLLSCPNHNIALTVLDKTFDSGYLQKLYCPYKFFYFNSYFYLYTLNPVDAEINTKPEKYFTCLMRSERPLRNYFYHLMKSNNILSKGYVSKINKPDFSHNLDVFKILKNTLSAEDYLLLLKNSKDTLEVDSDYDTRPVFNRTKIKDSSILEVVLEASTEDGQLVISEKTLNALRLKRFFLIVGNYKSLEFIRKYLGFKTFSHIFDESYDDIKDPIVRANKVFEQLKWFCSLSKAELENLINDNKELLEYNYNHFYNSLDIQSSVISKIENYFNKGEHNGRN